MALLRPIQDAPLCAATARDALTQPVTPSAALFVRHHFPVPAIDPASWRLRIEGACARPLSLSLADLRARPARDVVVTLECAGNSRTRLSPPVAGVPWNDHAVGTVRFSGVPLAALLMETGPLPGVVEASFEGLDRGAVAGRDIAFARSLELPVALQPDVLVATEMNGEPIGADHGGPVRLVVPGWYAVASVKWLGAIRLLLSPFAGHFQRDDYLYRLPNAAPQPVQRLRVKSLIVSPSDGAAVRRGAELEARGWAWSGEAPIDRVEVSADGGASWHAAALGDALGPHAWRAFSWRWRPESAGEATLLSRAMDEAGHGQPLAPAWNEKGYGNNAVVPVRVRVD